VHSASITFLSFSYESYTTMIIGGSDAYCRFGLVTGDWNIMNVDIHAKRKNS